MPFYATRQFGNFGFHAIDYSDLLIICNFVFTVVSCIQYFFTVVRLPFVLFYGDSEFFYGNCLIDAKLSLVIHCGGLCYYFYVEIDFI